VAHLLVTLVGSLTSVMACMDMGPGLVMRRVMRSPKRWHMEAGLVHLSSLTSDTAFVTSKKSLSRQGEDEAIPREMSMIGGSCKMNEVPACESRMFQCRVAHGRVT